MPVRVVRATDLQPDLAARFDLADARLEVICPERHPLFSADEAILQFTESLNCRVRLSHHLSLEDPLLRCFSGGVLEAFMSQLGMTDTDCISHAMIGRRIRAAQRQIEQRTSSRLPAASAAEWFELNAPEFKA